MKTHIAEIKAIAHHLGEVGRPVDERELITKIVCTLPIAYRPFVSSWRHSPLDRQNIATLTSLLQEREIAKWTPKAVDNPESAFHAQPSTNRDYNQETFHAQPSTSSYGNGNRGSWKRGGRGNNRGNRGRNYQERQSSGKGMHCDYCFMDNHNTEDCHTKRRHERVEQEKTELAKRRRKDNGAMAVDVSTVDIPLQDQDFSLVSTAPRFNTRSTGDWFADSGATQHMTDQKESLLNFTPVPEDSWTVRGIGTSNYSVKGYGDVHIWTTVGGEQKPATIKKVLYVPGLGTNLFSIAVVTDLGWTVTFTGTLVHFASMEDNVVMVGERIGRTLYLLAIQPRNQQDGQDSVAFPSSLSPGLSTWHRRLAHVNYKTIIKMMSSGAVEGLDLASTVIPSEPCAGCAYGKHQRLPFSSGRTRATYTGELIHSDLCGPMERATPNGALYFALFIDDYSGWRFIYFLKLKSEAAGCFMDLIHVVRGETGNLVRNLRTDNGGEWSSNDFAAWMIRKGIRHETSAPHTPEQDGVSERGVRTVTEGTRTCLHDCQPPFESWGENVTSGTEALVKECRLPFSLWAEAASYTVYTLNRVLSKVSSVTPYEAWHNKRPNLSHLRAFGSIAFVHIPKAERRKLDQKSVRCIFVGYSLTQKAYRFWDPTTRTIKISRDATFDEHHRLVDVPDEPQENTRQLLLPAPVIRVQEDPSPDNIEEHNTDIPQELSAPISNNSPTQPEEPDRVIESMVEQEPQLRRSARGRVPLREWKAWSAQFDGVEPYEPSSYSEAISCPEADKWKSAIQEEYQSLIENGTWSITPCPPGREPIKSRWVFKIKPTVNGELPRYKARFVAKGFSQRPGIDFNDTYASVVAHDTLRVLMSTIAADDLEMIQLDVKTAFLNGNLKEDLYIVQPEGFVVPGRESEVCHLKRCIYGLKQAPCVWGELFTDFLKKHNFIPSDADPCLFTRIRGTEKTFLIIYVDDGIIASNQQSAIDDLLVAFGERFQIRFNEVNRFVGITVTRKRQERKIFLSQPDYIEKIVKTFQMASCFPKSVPADPNVRLTKPTTAEKS